MFTFIVIIGFVIFSYFTYQQNNKKKIKQVHQTITRGVKKQNIHKLQTQFDHIKALDPNFDEHKMIIRVENAFYKIKQAWSDHDMSSVRGFITDGIFQRYSIQFDIQKKHQRHRKLVDLAIHHCELVGIEADKRFETLHFKISSQARHVTLNTQKSSAQQITKLPASSHTVEYWTYIRLPGVKTRTQPGLLEGICPNCGSTLLLNKFEQCQACDSLVTSGEYDWILAKITKEEEWRFQNAKRQVKGVAAYQVVDPLFNLAVIEDRVSVIFWRLQKAWLIQNAAPLRAVSDSNYVKHFEQNKLNGYYFDDIDLGLCEVSSVEFGNSVNEAKNSTDTFDKVFILVKWKARKISIDNGQSNPLGYYAHHLTLSRKTGAISNNKQGLHSLHCHSCGAPQSEKAIDHCQYCQTPFNRGEFDWVLTDFAPHINRVVDLKGKSFSIESGANKITDKIFDPISLLSGLVLILLADGEKHPKEQALLNDFVKNRRIPQQILDEILVAAENGELTMLAPDEQLDAAAWLIKMIEMCLIDGEISTQEHELLVLFGKKFNILAIEIDIRIKETRSKLYLDAKRALTQDASINANSNAI
ncbi:TIM44-like domain-containing protein [Colwellia sp. E2M01]|uniref:TIM44-like domain-containing protein n=1 Tax=Colwellia sp. E2M01 TaxID=2841561 RepID=UPI001C098F80|nr:TIM44-like domain-containing protein [Colwellia sp. E2M01]MBU2869482.1 TIM44-like domain-containing protein [Colwellia sp. E2M01]